MFQVGQVLYVVSQKKQQVFPVRIVEQVVRKSLDNETISYQVEIPGKESNKRIELSKLGPHVYDDLNEIRRTLIKNASDKIDEIVTMAGNVASEIFGEKSFHAPQKAIAKHVQSPKENTEEEYQTPFDQEDSDVKITLPDGSIANVNLNSIESPTL